MCEAFLRITHHFGLWLKTFDVKPKMVEGQYAAFGGALISKIAGATWPKGSFPEVSGWQQGWFYITEPRDATWAEAPEFKAGAPMQLTSWKEKGPNWSASDELIALQTRTQSMVDKTVKLVDVIQVMLVRRILPWQSLSFPLWEFDPVKH